MTAIRRGCAMLSDRGRLFESHWTALDSGHSAIDYSCGLALAAHNHTLVGLSTLGGNVHYRM